MTALKRYRVYLKFTSSYTLEVLARDAAHAERVASAVYDSAGSTDDFEPDYDRTEFTAEEVRP